MTLTALPVRLVLYAADTLDAGKDAGERSLVTEMLERLVHKRLLFLLDADFILSNPRLDIPIANVVLGNICPLFIRVCFK